ncbi:MAG: hypothetical protein FWE63_01690 [Bacteroidales bacterium]|nr:hypothetical protein [Bacteroidales bacterium]
MTNKYEPHVRTFLKVKIGEETVMVEDVNFEKIVDWSRNWNYSNGQFKIQEAETKTAWKEYNRNVRHKE